MSVRELVFFKFVFLLCGVWFVTHLFNVEGAGSLGSSWGVCKDKGKMAALKRKEGRVSTKAKDRREANLAGLFQKQFLT